MSTTNRPTPRLKGPVRQDDKARRERDRRLGLFVMEVARATHEGRLPVSQTDIKRALKKNFRLDLPNSTCGQLAKILKNQYRNKTWLKVDGHKVTLYSEEETLVDSRAIRALFIARDELNDDGNIAIVNWKAMCSDKLNLSDEMCDEFITDFVRCRYVRPPDDRGLIEVDVRAIGEDDFYLSTAVKAGLKKSTARTTHAKS
jgi:hypothetical protein